MIPAPPWRDLLHCLLAAPLLPPEVLLLPRVANTAQGEASL